MNFAYREVSLPLNLWPELVTCGTSLREKVQSPFGMSSLAQLSLPNTRQHEVLHEAPPACGAGESGVWSGKQ